MRVSLCLFCTVWIFSVVGGLQFPVVTNGAVGRNVVFAPLNPPSTAVDTVSWQCTIAVILSGSPASPTISPEYTGRVRFDSNDFALELLDLTLKDAGTYSLILETAGSALFGGTSLQMYELISDMKLTGPEEELIEGESSATLTSRGSGNITSIEWMKDNTPLNPSENIIFSPDNRAVSISPVQRSDSGEYEVKYSNPVSSGTSTLRLTINYGPEDVSVEGPEVVDLGVKITLSCSAMSLPPASFSWTFNGTDTGVTTSKYTIEETDITNTGEYTCTAFNSITNRRDSQNHTLKVQQGGAGGGGLSPGAIAGIVIGVLLAVSGICGLIVYLVKTKKIPKIELGSSREASRAESQRAEENEIHYADIRHNKRKKGDRVEMANISEPRTEYAEIRHEANSRENPPPYGSQR